MSHSQNFNYDQEYDDGSGYYPDPNYGEDDTNGYYDENEGYESYLCDHGYYFNDCKLCSQYHQDMNRGGTGTTPPLGRRQSSARPQNHSKESEKNSQSTSQDQIDSGQRSGEVEIQSAPEKSSVGVESNSQSEEPPISIKQKPYVEVSSDPGKSSKVNGKNLCSHCNRFGHVKDTCFALVACSECGKKGHPAKWCRERSKSKKSKGQGDRNVKKNDLISKSLSVEDDKNLAKEDALRDEIIYLKEIVEDVSVAKEDEKEKEKIVIETKQNEARREKRYGKKKRTQDEFVRSLYRDDELGYRPVDVPILVSEVPEGGWVDPGMFPLPSPVDVVDDYDEDPRSYTFTSPVDLPSGRMFYDFARESLSWELLSFLIVQFIGFCCCCFLFAPPIFLAIVGSVSFVLAPFAVHITLTAYVFWILLIFCINASFVTFAFGTCRFGWKVVKMVGSMIRWKHSYTHVAYMDKDEVDLRTDNQMRSEGKHLDAVYARFRYTRRIHISMTECYKDTGAFTVLLSRLIAWSIALLGKHVPGWLVEMDKEIVISLEAFDQVKDLTNMDFESSDAVASDKIRTGLKRVGTILINRHLKVDPVYSTVFLCWAYFKHQQQKTRVLPFYRAPLNLT